jgi:uncharacterized protein (DUF2252 family)
MRDPIEEFQDFNRTFAQRNPELLRLKIARMAAGPFAFFRGTFHLFARDLLEQFFDTVGRVAGAEAEMELVGDIHSENFGTYQGDDGEVHYDINDFDETTHGRFDFDVRRLSTSLILASRERGFGLGDAVLAALAFLGAYSETVRRLLKKGKPADLDITAASPPDCPALQRLLRESAATKRPAFINRLTETKNGQRRLVRSLHLINLAEADRALALRLVEDYRRRMPPPSTPDFYEVVDVCGRVSGIGSMGRFRFAVLVAGKGNKDARNVLLEFKEARPSAYDLYRQRANDAEALVQRAERVIAFQKASQAASNSRLGFAVDGPMSFQVRELGPRDARLDLKTVKDAAELQQVAQVLAALLARTHARSAARAVGVANPLAELDDVDAFCQRMLAFALAYAELVQRDYNRFVGHRAELEHCEEWAQVLVEKRA